MTTARNAGLARLDVLVGAWELSATSEGRLMSTARSTFRWFGSDRAFLVQRTDPPTHLVPEWVAAAPEWSDVVLGFDDHSGAFTALYADSRGVCRAYQMTFDASAWTLASRPGPEFHQRFDGTVATDGIDGTWQASDDGQT